MIAWNGLGLRHYTETMSPLFCTHCLISGYRSVGDIQLFSQTFLCQISFLPQFFQERANLDLIHMGDLLSKP